MRAQLIHLSGPRRGRTDTPAGPGVTIGSDSRADIRFPPGSGVGLRHAAVTFDECGCDFLIKAVDGDVFVNHEEIREVILRHGDLLEFGTDGPKARFRVWRKKGPACKPVHTMLGDAAAVGRESGVVASGSALARDLLTQATWAFKIGLPLLVLGAIALAFAGGWFGGGRAVETRVRYQLDQLRTELAELRARQTDRVTRAEIESIRTELATRAAELDRIAGQQTILRTILDHHSRGVCLIHGTWGFRLPEPLRSPGMEFVLGRDGLRAELEYTGSGFHVGEGRVVTNRHVALPWESADEVSDLLRGGFEPVMFRLTVTFPGHEPAMVDVDATKVRLTDRIDVAVLRAVVPDDVPVLELDDRPAEHAEGETVLVVGYPTGVNALLAKADEAVSRAIVDDAGGDLGKVIAGLADRNAISPVVTRGVLAEVRVARLVYDAETTSGGSGGPVFGASGRVVGVNFAIVSGFGGSNFGVPVRYARDLLE